MPVRDNSALNPAPLRKRKQALGSPPSVLCSEGALHILGPTASWGFLIPLCSPKSQPSPTDELEYVLFLPSRPQTPGALASPRTTLWASRGLERWFATLAARWDGLGSLRADGCLGTTQANKTPLSAGGAPVLAFCQGSLADFNL